VIEDEETLQKGIVMMIRVGYDDDNDDDDDDDDDPFRRYSMFLDTVITFIIFRIPAHD
jgi:hypothetical protein